MKIIKILMFEKENGKMVENGDERPENNSFKLKNYTFERKDLLLN